MEQVDLIEFDGDPMRLAGSTRVEGDVDRIPDILWPALDAWEEVPRVYQRRRRCLSNGRRVWVLRSTLSQYREGSLETAEQHLHGNCGEQQAHHLGEHLKGRRADAAGQPFTDHEDRKHQRGENQNQ